MKASFLAVVNPAAGNGRCGKLVGSVLDRLRASGVRLDIVYTERPGHATELVRDAVASGFHQFVAVGGDGTAFEIVNGLFTAAQQNPRPTLAFLPLGTGNSFLRDFTTRGVEHALEALTTGRRRPCDVLRLTHRRGVLHYINLLSMGFPADVATIVNRWFKPLGELGYLLGVFTCLVRLRQRAFPLRVDEEPDVDRRPCLFLTFSNSKFTGGKMMIAPQADVADGLIEVVRWGPVGRLELVRNLPGLYDGTHILNPKSSRRQARRIDFELEEPVNVMVDGEVLTLHCQRLEVLPAALHVVV